MLNLEGRVAENNELAGLEFGSTVVNVAVIDVIRNCMKVPRSWKLSNIDGKNVDYVQYNGIPLLMVIYEKEDFEIKKGEKWLEVTVLGNFVDFVRKTRDYLDKEERKFIKLLAHYKAADKVFSEYDGIYGIINEDNTAVETFIKKGLGAEELAEFNTEPVETHERNTPRNKCLFSREQWNKGYLRKKVLESYG